MQRLCGGTVLREGYGENRKWYRQAWNKTRGSQDSVVPSSPRPGSAPLSHQDAAAHGAWSKPRASSGSPKASLLVSGVRRPDGQHDTHPVNTAGLHPLLAHWDPTQGRPPVPLLKNEEPCCLVTNVGHGRSMASRCVDNCSQTMNWKIWTQAGAGWLPAK